MIPTRALTSSIPSHNSHFFFVMTIFMIQSLASFKYTYNEVLWQSLHPGNWHLKMWQEFLGSLVVGTWCFHSCGPRFVDLRSHSLWDQSCILSHIQLCGTPWTVAQHSPLFMGFSKKNTAVGCYFLLQQQICFFLMHLLRSVVAGGLMAQHALFADKAGNLFHSHSSFLPSDLICLAAPIGVHGQKTWKCWLPGSASSTQIRGER